MLPEPGALLLEQRLGLRLADAEQAIAPDEPFALEGPARGGLRRLALSAVEHGWSEADERAVARAAGWLPPGELGYALWGRERGPVRAFAPRLFDARPEAAPQPLPVDANLAGVRVHGWLDGVTAEGLFDWRLTRPGPWDLPRFWLRHLLLNLSATDGIGRESRLLSPAGDWRLGPLDDAAELLEPWLAAYRQALCEPLPLLTRASHDFAQALASPGARSQKPPVEAARAKARVAWEGSEFGLAGECCDPWYALAFRDRDPLDARFEALAERLLGPALAALAGEDEA